MANPIKTDLKKFNIELMLTNLQDVMGQEIATISRNQDILNNKLTKTTDRIECLEQKLATLSKRFEDVYLYLKKQKQST